MTSKQYTERGNCARAAKSSLGKEAKAGVDFIITETTTDAGKRFTWAPAATKPKKVREPKGDAAFQHQPQNVKMLNLIARKMGATIAQLQEALGVGQPHTIRGSISRCRSEGVEITKVQEGRKVTYHLAREAE